jgi:4-hydroxy-4-methyl-2-oxoglutarate aldolase
MKKSMFLFVSLALLLSLQGFSQIVTSPENIKFFTGEWTGKRTPDGRPYVEDKYLDRLLNLSIEEVWAVLRNHGYNNQYEGGFEIVHPDKPFAGRAVTALYMPTRPDVHARIVERGEAEGHIGPPNSWPIDVLKNGDVYVADARGKIINGTLIGDNLANSIYAKSGKGVVFEGSARDLEGIEKVQGFNALVRGFDPSFIMELTMMGINVPIQVGRAIVMPGDVVMAKKTGVIFIPAHLVEEAVITGEFVQLRDMFGHKALREGWFTTGQIDSKWTDEIKNAFYKWLDENPKLKTLSREEMEKMFSARHW